MPQPDVPRLLSIPPAQRFLEDHTISILQTIRHPLSLVRVARLRYGESLGYVVFIEKVLHEMDSLDRYVAVEAQVVLWQQPCGPEMSAAVGCLKVRCPCSS